MSKEPKTYDGLIEKFEKAAKNNELEKAVNSTADFLKAHADTTEQLGYIAPSSREAYSIFSTAPKDKPIPYAICGPMNQIIADALNDAGIEARLINVGAARSGTGGNHYALIYKNKDGQYTINDYKASKKINANNILDAAKEAEAYHPTLMSLGPLSIMSKDGKHIAYNEISIGDKLAVNPDKNSVENLSKPFNTLKNQGDKESVDFHTKKGTDKLGGEFSSLGTNIESSKDFPLANSTLQVDAKGSYDFLNVNYKTNTMNKDIDYHLLGGELQGTLKSDKLKIAKDAISAQGFASTSIKGDLIYRDGSISKVNESKRFSVETEGDFSLTHLMGATTQIKTEKSETNMTLLGGIRNAKDTDIFKQSISLKPEYIKGAEIENSTTIPLNGANLTLKGTGSAVQVTSGYYDKETLKAEGEVGIGSQKKFSLYSGITQENTNLKEVGEKKTQQEQYLGLKYQAPIGKRDLLLNMRSTGKDLQLKTSINF